MKAAVSHQINYNYIQYRVLGINPITAPKKGSGINHKILRQTNFGNQTS